MRHIGDIYKYLRHFLYDYVIPHFISFSDWFIRVSHNNNIFVLFCFICPIFSFSIFCLVLLFDFKLCLKINKCVYIYIYIYFFFFLNNYNSNECLWTVIKRRHDGTLWLECIIWRIWMNPVIKWVSVCIYISLLFYVDLLSHFNLCKSLVYFIQRPLRWKKSSPTRTTIKRQTRMILPWWN